MLWPPPWLIEEQKQRREQERDGGLVPLHIPLPEVPERRRPDDYPHWEPTGRAPSSEKPEGGTVIIIDLYDDGDVLH